MPKRDLIESPPARSDRRAAGAPLAILLDSLSLPPLRVVELENLAA